MSTSATVMQAPDASHRIETAQMNTRLDQRLKTAGDAVLKELGYTPSVAVRALWRYLVEHRHDEEAIRRLIEPQSTPLASEEAERKLAAMQRVHERYHSLADQLGFANLSPDWEPPSYRELLNEHYEELLCKMEEPA